LTAPFSSDSVAWRKRLVNDLHFAVVVGINRYPGIRDLRFARSDAELFRDWLLDPAGGNLPPENVRLVTAADDAAYAVADDARPTRTEVNRALREVNLAATAKVQRPDDRNGTRLYVYVSGHGIAPANGKAALLMANAERDVLGENIELSLYGDWYERCGVFAELVVFADCCRELRAAAAPGGPPFNVCDRPRGPTSRLLAFAAGIGEDAYEPTQPPADPDAARGFFTRALLDALRGGASDPTTGLVTAGRLATYVQESVDALSRDAPERQRVEIVTTLPAELVLARIAARGDGERPKRRVTITFRPGDTGDVVVTAGPATVVAGGRASESPWILELEEGFYEVATTGPATRPISKLFKVVGEDVNVAA
jgi:uncharacterized caspase-like protein